jgi:hypothetical protein
MFWGVMKPLRTRMLEFALLVAVMLPLQGFASASGCGPFAAIASTEHCNHAAKHPAGTGQLHDCGTCCSVAALSAAPLLWAAPRLTSPKRFLPLFWSPPAVVLDRLDRPPRFIPA